MGAQGDFERRREELAIISKKEMSDISDDVVVDSFVSSLNQVICICILRSSLLQTLS